MLTNKFSKWLLRPVSNRGLESIHGFQISLGSDIGSVREENQDRVAVMKVSDHSPSTSPFIVIALADGMGGMLDGSECAAKAVGAFFNSLIRDRQLAPENRLVLAANEANETVNSFSGAKGGATLSALLFDASGCSWSLNIGDSRIYASSDSIVTRLTTDDSLEEAVGGHGKELLQFIGMGEGLIPHISAIPRDLEKLIITSDGVHFVSHSLLSDILINANSPAETVDQLLTAAKWRGAPDNASTASIFMDTLFDSLKKDNEPGIEISDPFGSTQIMWVKQNQTDKSEDTIIPPIATDQSDKDSDKPFKPPVPQKKQSKKTSNTKQKQPSEKPETPKADEELQIEIDIEPISDISTKEGASSDNSK